MGPEKRAEEQTEDRSEKRSEERPPDDKRSLRRLRDAPARATVPGRDFGRRSASLVPEMPAPCPDGISCVADTTWYFVTSFCEQRFYLISK